MTISSLVTCSQDREVRMFLRHVSTSSGRIYTTLGSDASCANRLVNCQPTFPGAKDWAKSSNSWNKLGHFFMRIWGVPPPNATSSENNALLREWVASFLEGWHWRVPSNSHGFLTIPCASICSNTSLSRHTSPLPKYLPLLWRCHCRSLPQRWQLERWKDFCWWFSPNFSCWNLFLQLSIDTKDLQLKVTVTSCEGFPMTHPWFVLRFLQPPQSPISRFQGWRRWPNSPLVNSDGTLKSAFGHFSLVHLQNGAYFLAIHLFFWSGTFI